MVVYTCFYFYAMVLLACPGYDTKTFVVTHGCFCCTSCTPKLIVVDHRPNLLAAAERPNWPEVAKTSGWSETDCQVILKGCP